MNFKTTLVPIVLALALPLAGCGNKGPLVQAERPAPVEAPETEPGDVPVEMAPDPATVDPATVAPPTVDTATVPSSELEPVDAPPAELPVDPDVVPEPETDEPVADPPPVAPADDGTDG